MKKLNLILLTVCSAFIGYAQQPIFSSVSLDDTSGRNIISFSVPREVNVRHYRIEAGNDNLVFAVIATIPSKGNSELSENYCYDLSGYSFKYYRIGMVGMNATMPYSQVVTSHKKAPIPGQRIQTQSAITSQGALAHK